MTRLSTSARRSASAVPRMRGDEPWVPHVEQRGDTVPRMRGDEPVWDGANWVTADCSPHARG